MPKLRVRIPVEVPVTEEDLAALGALGRVVKVARESGLLDAMREFVEKADASVTTRRRRRRR